MTPIRGFAILFVLVLLALAVPRLIPPSAQAPTPMTPHAKSTAEPQSPTSNPLSVDQSLASFDLMPDFSIRCIASEPVVAAPVAACFDENGRLFVAQMNTYMPDIQGTGELAPANKVLLLTDNDNDGVYDSSSVFLDRLVLPRSIAPCFGGLLLIEPPNLYICHDTDGDGRADSKEKLLGGFGGLDNPEHAANSLTFGHDGWWHLSQHDTEFRITKSATGYSVTTRPTPVHGQWGLAKDDLGRFYSTPNSNPLLCDILPKHLAMRNPGSPTSRGFGSNIMPDASVWPLAKNPGVNRAYQPNILKKDGTLANHTAACGTSINRDIILGPDAANNAFVCEPAGNLVKRILITDDDGAPAARSFYTGTELLRSTDERFRPVNSLVAPDGSLLILDMYRGVIQHKKFLTDFLKAQIKERDLETPLNMGRIYQITRRDIPLRSQSPRLSSASNADLVALLTSASGWWRDTAQRLLIERHATDQTDALRTLARGANPLGAIHALWTLDAISQLSASEVSRALLHPSIEVQANAAHLAQNWIGDDSVPAAIIEVCRSESTPRLVLLAALPTLVSTYRQPEQATDLAAFLLTHQRDPFLRSALWTARPEIASSAAIYLLSQPAVRADLLRECVQAALRGPASFRPALFSAVGASSHGEVLLPTLAKELKIDDPRPPKLSLSQEPTRFISLCTDPSLSTSAQEQAKRIANLLDWPGKQSGAAATIALRDLTPIEKTRFELGKSLYSTCASCHGVDGKGQPGQAPPIAGSKRINGPEGVLVRIILQGVRGEYEVNGQTFTGEMPIPQITEDEELASVLTYVRRAFGNRADPISPETIAAIREETSERNGSWTHKELDELAK
ncbi:MAG: c-type cytochrome [Planctomycetes bacterium]|nr:c-type cytochrome [Planctomycetota bacterium]